MSTSSDDDFFAALAGSPREGVSAEVARQAAALRTTIGAYDRHFDAKTRDTERDLAPLLFRLRREGLLDRPRARWLAPAAAAAVIVLGVVSFAPQFWPRGSGDEASMRGVRVQVIEVDDLDGRVAAIVVALKAHGAQPQVYPLGIHRGINASVALERRQAAREALRAFGIDLPANGELRLEVRAALAGK